MRDSKIDQKQPTVKEVATLLDGASSAVVVGYHGFTIKQDTQFREQPREAGVVCRVHKNTIIHVAAKGTDFEKSDAYLEGPTALAISKDDATVAARVLAKFTKTALKLGIKGGTIESAAYDAEGMAAIAAVPSRKELLGKLFDSIQSPVTNFARVIKQIAEKDAAPTAE